LSSRNAQRAQSVVNVSGHQVRSAQLYLPIAHLISVIPTEQSVQLSVPNSLIRRLEREVDEEMMRELALEGWLGRCLWTIG
jgi:hypothetical protein